MLNSFILLLLLLLLPNNAGTVKHTMLGLRAAGIATLDTIDGCPFWDAFNIIGCAPSAVRTLATAALMAQMQLAVPAVTDCFVRQGLCGQCSHAARHVSRGHVSEARSPAEAGEERAAIHCRPRLA